MRAFAVYTSLRYVLIGIGIIMAHIWNAPPDHLAVIWTFTEGTLLVVLICELLATVQLRRARGWFGWTKKHVSYGARGLLATLAFEVNSKIDVWMLGVALPESLVGVYSLASTLFEGAAQLGVVVQNNVNPMIAHDLAEGRRSAVDALIKRTRRWFVPTMVAACLVAIVMYPIAIPTLVGDPSFVIGTKSFAILMLGLALTTPWLPFNQLLLMAARPGWHTIYVLVMFATSFAGNYLLIPALHLEGAARRFCCRSSLASRHAYGCDERRYPRVTLRLAPSEAGVYKCGDAQRVECDVGRDRCLQRGQGHPWRRRGARDRWLACRRHR